MQVEIVVYIYQRKFDTIFQFIHASLEFWLRKPW